MIMSHEKLILQLETITIYLPIPFMKCGYKLSVNKASGSSRKYSFRTPVMTFMSTSLTACTAARLSANKTIIKLTEES